MRYQHFVIKGCFFICLFVCLKGICLFKILLKNLFLLIDKVSVCAHGMHSGHVEVRGNLLHISLVDGKPAVSRTCP